jgi:WD40 repeat protein
MIKPVLINPAKRMVRQKSALSALLVTGSDKVESGFGNGDCLLLDFSRLIFAVSDGSERYTQASKILLERFVGFLSEQDISPDISVLKKSIEAIYGGQKYTHKCTFSCVAFAKNRKEVIASISSGGDSMVIIADSTDGSIIFKTIPDMNFAGRSKNVPGISTFTLKDRKFRVVIATDGFAEVLNKIEKQKQGKLPKWIFKGPACGITGKVYGKIKRNKLDYDDIGMIVIDPFDISREDKSILIGGTSPHKEALFAASYSDCGSRWIEKNKWRENEETLEAAGITILMAS